MPSAVEHFLVDCPYCGEENEIVLEASTDGDDFIEDCQVCCRPISYQLVVSINGEQTLMCHAEDETDSFF